MEKKTHKPGRDRRRVTKGRRVTLTKQVGCGGDPLDALFKSVLGLPLASVCADQPKPMK